MEYATVMSEDRGEFDRGVDAMILMGWKLYGNPYSLVGPGLVSSQCQAMTRDAPLDLTAVEGFLVAANVRYYLPKHADPDTVYAADQKYLCARRDVIDWLYEQSGE